MRTFGIDFVQTLLCQMTTADSSEGGPTEAREVYTTPQPRQACAKNEPVNDGAKGRMVRLSAT
jgi:hypothetical protein